MEIKDENGAKPVEIEAEIEIDLPKEMPPEMRDFLKKMVAESNGKIRVERATVSPAVGQKVRNAMRKAAGMRRYPMWLIGLNWFLGNWWRPVRMALHNKGTDGPQDMEDCWAVTNQFMKAAIGGTAVTSKEMAKSIAYGMNRYAKQS